MESITRKGWTTKTNLTSPKTNLALEQMLVGRIRGHVDFCGNESWIVMVGNSNLKPVTTVTSTLFITHIGGTYFLNNAKPYGLNANVICSQNCHCLGWLASKKDHPSEVGLANQKKWYLKCTAQMNRHIWFLEMISIWWVIFVDLCCHLECTIGVVDDFKHNLWMINCMYCLFHARMYHDLSTSLRQCPGNRIMIEHVQILPANWP